VSLRCFACLLLKLLKIGAAIVLLKMAAAGPSPKDYCTMFFKPIPGKPLFWACQFEDCVDHKQEFKRAEASGWSNLLVHLRSVRIV